MAVKRNSGRMRTPEERRQALLKAAEETFFAKGYFSTSLDDIIALAGGSKRTIYTEFGGKEGLLTALVTETADQFAHALTPSDKVPNDLRAQLMDFGMRLIRVVMSPSVLGMYRIIVTDSGRFPHLADMFFAAGPVRAVTNLAEVLSAAKDRGELKNIDCTLVANHFVGMFGDPYFLQVVLNQHPVPDETHMERVVQSLVNMVLGGVRPCEKRSFAECERNCPFQASCCK